MNVDKWNLEWYDNENQKCIFAYLLKYYYIMKYYTSLQTFFQTVFFFVYSERKHFFNLFTVFNKKSFDIRFKLFFSVYL